MYRFWYFCYIQEVIGGVLDIEPRRWRKPQKESFEEQRKKVMNLAKIWKPYDFTVTRDESSSSSEEDND